MNLIEKEKKLRNYIKNLNSCLVALSGGVDSSYLTLIAHQELGDKMLAVTADSPSLPDEMKKIVQKFVKKFKIPHIFIKTEEIKDPVYYKNEGLRCYACKRELFSKMKKIKEKKGFNAIIEGTQGSDLSDERPGRKAAKELNVLSPLILFDFQKDEIRKRAKILGIEHFKLPESACLGSRIIQGEEITEEKLKQVEKGEEFLKKLGFKKIRVRHHNLLARIEVEKEEIGKFFDMKFWEKVCLFFKKIGFQFVTIDMEGYKRGGGNIRKIIKNKERSGV